MSLRFWILGSAALVFVVVFAIIASVFGRELGGYAHVTAERSALIRGEALALSFANALEGEWQRARVASARVDLDGDPAIVQAMLEGFAPPGGHVSWVGVMDMQGTVFAAAAVNPVDAGISARRWVAEEWARRGVGGARLRVMTSDQGIGASRHSLHFSLPITDAAGKASGVWAMHIDWQWVRGLLGDAARSLELEAMLTDHSGDILASTLDVEWGLSGDGIAALRAAALGVRGAFVSDWPDGQRYFSAAIPQVASGPQSSLGWALVVRLNANGVATGARQFRDTIAMHGGVVLVGGIFVFAFITCMTLRPLVRLVAAIGMIARGEDAGYLDGARGYREVAILSDAVVRLQAGDDP